MLIPQQGNLFRQSSLYSMSFPTSLYSELLHDSPLFLSHFCILCNQCNSVGNITFTTFHTQMMLLLSHFCFSLNSDCTYTRCAIQCSYVSSERYRHGCRMVQLYILHILPLLSSNIEPFLLQV